MSVFSKKLCFYTLKLDFFLIYLSRKSSYLSFIQLQYFIQRNIRFIYYTEIRAVQVEEPLSSYPILKFSIFQSYVIFQHTLELIKNRLVLDQSGFRYFYTFFCFCS
ncbi:unnamed protein product [Paramecium sonneborni]|uniref:Uncharacterized protein n=1 Tax=Paramecium sonneborni TaxID=65129 RepID=A0A8S1RRM4_9CILI|nr:unnamed protein product [Paramecium sonneborni]